MTDQIVSGERRINEQFSFLHSLLCQLYSEKHRAYHNLNHIKSLLDFFENFSKFIKDKPCVFFAIWFHDAIYDPQKKDNEKQSAELAVKFLKTLSLPVEKISKIERMILATEKHSAEELDADGKLFLDFDLGILGAESEIYKEYAKAIREEYSFVSEEDYKIGRGRILQNFLKRETIYFTDVMREKFETKANENIENEILELKI
jgi:predicted metal-dependent HD superfamily phosphohydrolase